jgi:hypothetical protein
MAPEVRFEVELKKLQTTESLILQEHGGPFRDPPLRLNKWIVAATAELQRTQPHA